MSSNKLLNTTSLSQIGKGSGKIPIQPLVNTGKHAKGPNKQLFLDIPYGEQTQINADVTDVVSIELQQIVVTGITKPASGILAIEFDGAGSTSALSTKTQHNLDNVHGNCLIFFYQLNADQVGVVSFAGDPIIMYQNRGSTDIRYVNRVKLVDVATGDYLTYGHVYMWCVMNTNTWQ